MRERKKRKVVRKRREKKKSTLCLRGGEEGRHKSDGDPYDVVNGVGWYGTIDMVTWCGTFPISARLVDQVVRRLVKHTMLHTDEDGRCRRCCACLHLSAIGRRANKPTNKKNDMVAYGTLPKRTASRNRVGSPG